MRGIKKRDAGVPGGLSLLSAQLGISSGVNLRWGFEFKTPHWAPR